MINLAQTYSQFLTKTRFEDISSDAISASKHIIADLIAAIIGGMAEPDLQQLVQHMAPDNIGEAGLFGL